MRPGVLTVYRWELRKLRSQKRTYIGLGAAVVVPLIFVAAVAIRSGGPEDVAFGQAGHVLTASQTRRRGGSGNAPTVHIEHATFTGTRAARAFADRMAYRVKVG